MPSYIKRILRDQSIRRFLIVGITSFAIDYGLLLTLDHRFKIPITIATTVGFLSGLVVNFIMNKYWTFNAPRSGRHSARQAFLYGMLVVVNLIFTDVFVTALKGFNLQPEITKPLATIVIMGSNYLIYQKVIFKKAEIDLDVTMV